MHKPTIGIPSQAGPQTITRQNVDSVYQRATGLFQQGRAGEAVRLFTAILKTFPTHAGAANALGVAAFQAGSMGEALQYLQQAVKVAPTFWVASVMLGQVWRNVGEYEASIAVLKKVPRSSEYYRQAQLQLAISLLQKGDLDAARTRLEKLAKQGFEPEKVRFHMGRYYMVQGEFEKADAAFREALAIDPAYGKAYQSIVTMKRYRDSKDPDIAAMRAILERRDVPSDQRISVLFALGKAHEDVGLYDAAFDYYAQGNAEKNATLKGWSAESEKRQGAEAVKVFPSLDTTPLQDPVRMPKMVFIVGMPRSGTTLIEQILGAHPEVQAGGELYFLDQGIRSLSAHFRKPFPDVLTDVSDDQIRVLRDFYIGKIESHIGAGPVVTDKMPFNFKYLGVIARAFPDAVVVNMEREPLDVCLSCFTNLFRGKGQAFSYSFEGLAVQYASYRRQMNVWADVIPESRLLNLRYEDLIAAPEASVQELLTHCGLDWDDACLNFQDSRGHVQTASVAQVRRGLYKDSVARWQRFEGQLEPLRRLLSENGVIQPYG